MLTRRHRFHGYGSLKRVYARGQSARSGPLSLKYAERDPARPYRVAVVVSKKVNKSAVARNRIRRRLYESVRRQQGVIKPGADLVFTVFSDQLITLDAGKLDSLVSDLLNKASLS
jgi:ribonuclease P protein component